MKLVFGSTAWDHLLHWREAERATLKKVNGLIKECQRHPHEGIGKPEPLKGDLAG